MSYLKVKKLHIDAQISRAEDSEGYDLHCIEDFTIQGQNTCGIDTPYEPSRKLINTGLALSIPKGYVGVIKDRSSIAFQGMHVLGGVIDTGYIGQLKIILYNTGYTTAYKFKKGDKIAQLLIVKVGLPEIEYVNELSQTKRGEKGFGEMTGK